MANRVVMDANGLKISKPGVNVLTASDNDLLFGTNIPMLQIVESGVLTGVGNNQTRDLTIPNMGFSPFVVASSQAYHVSITYPNATTVRLRTSSKTWATGANTSVSYAVTNVPVT